MKARAVSNTGWEGKVEQKKDGLEVQTEDKVQQAHTASSAEIAKDPDKAKRAADEMSNKLNALDRERDSREEVTQQMQEDIKMEENREVSPEEIGDYMKDFSDSVSGSMTR